MATQEYRVMLVENDTELLQDMAAVVQETVGFQLATAYSDARDALNQGGIFRPTLILLDVDYVDSYGIIEDFRQRFPNAHVLALGNKWSLTLFRSVIKAGAGGFLITPFSSLELINSVRVFEERDEIESQVYAFFSPKGKSGKTTFIANLAMQLAEESQSRVAIIDADLQFGDMAVFFNLNPQSTVVEAVRDISFLSPTTLNSYFIPVSDKVSVLCGTRTPELAEQVMPEDFTALVQMARGVFRYILIDLPPAFRPITNAACEVADKTVVMAMVSGGFEIQHVSRCLDIFRTWDDFKNRVRVVFSRVEPCTEDMRKRLEEEIGNPVDAIIPNEYLLLSTAANNGRIVADIRPESTFAGSVAAIAKKLYLADRKG
jgi:pilus assembly protein CpaE